jgi:ribonuclease E
LQLLRAIEEMLIKGATHNLIVRTRAEVALYVLNHKRAHLRALEERFRITITVSADPAVTGQQSYVIDRGEQVHTPEAARNLAAQQLQLAPVAEMEDETVEVDEHFEEAESPAETEQRVEGGEREGGERDGSRRRRRRRGRGGRGRGGEPREPVQNAQNGQNFTQDTAPEHTVTHEDHDGGSPEEDGLGQPQPRQEGASGEGETREGRRRRRRGRRGGRRNRQRNGEAPFRSAENGSEPELHQTADQFDSPSTYHGRDDFSQPAEQPSEPEPQAPVFSAQESPRRRSTIREPAPFASETPPPAPAPASPPAPVISSTGAEETATPKRGWWGKRLLGDKG